MSSATEFELRELKVGGPVDSTEQPYVSREADQEFLDLLQAGEFVNVVTSRQMGKTSLVYHAMIRLAPLGYQFAYFDLSKLRSEIDARRYFQTLVGEIARELNSEIDLNAFWELRSKQTVSQGFVDFFRQVLAELVGKVIVVLDEIDSTLERDYTDDLFTAIRSIYAARPHESAFKRLTFCLVGVASPNELIKTPRTTPYNVGRTIWLRDFDRECDNLSPLTLALNCDSSIADQLLRRVLYWTDGQPYLTAWMCDELRRQRASEQHEVDALVVRSLSSLDRLRSDPHFEQTQRFINERAASGVEVLGLYERILRGKRELDQAANPVYAHLKLSGLVKRDEKGILVARNRIYQRLFNLDWVRKSRPRQEVRRARWFVRATVVLLAFSLISGGAYFLAAVRPLQQASNARDALQNLQVALIRNSYGWTDVEVPSKDRKSVLMQALPHLMKLEELENGDNGRMLSFSLDDEKDIDPEIFLYLPWARRLSLAGARIEDIESLRTLNRLQILSITETNVTDLGPVASLSKLVDLSIRGTRVVDISPLRQLLSLRHLSLPNTGVSNLEALTAMHQLEVLDLAGTKVSDLRPFKWLYSLKKLAVDMTEVDDLAPLSGLANLETLSASFTKVRNLRPPVALKALIRLDVSDTFTIDVTPLANLSNLQELNLSRTHVNKFGLQPLQALTKLRTLALDGTGVRDFNADGHLVGLNVLQDPPPPRADALYPVKASFRDCAECPQMLVVPSGTFQMGSPKSEEGRFDNEELPKTVTLAHSFAVGRYEVRSDEWMHCVRAGACKWMSHEGWGRGFRPVISTSWDDAQTYVAWLSKKTGKSYRLLTEVEWEYVARAGSNSSRPWQDANGERCRVANVDDHSLRAPFSFFDRCDDGYTNTAPVGTYLPNAFGAHDTIGNVMEWVADCLDTPDRGLNESGRRPAPATKSCEKRVARGGSWFSDSRQSRFAVRAGEPSGTSSPEFGFRVARTLAKR